MLNRIFADANKSSTQILCNTVFCLFVLLSSAWTHNAHAISTSECTQYGGKYQCIQPDPPRATTDWVYPLGGKIYPTEAQAIAALRRSYRCGDGNVCDYELTPSWDTNTIPIGSESQPVGVVWSYPYQNTDIIWKQTKKGTLRVYSATNPNASTTYNHLISRTRTVQDYTCPVDTEAASSNTAGLTHIMCYKPKADAGATCSAATPHPCSITTGNKFKPQLDWQASIGQLFFQRMYNSLASAQAPTTPMGAAWTHNYNLRLKVDPTALNQLILQRADGRQVYATNTYTDTTLAGTNGWFINRNLNLKLSQLADGTWQVLNITDNSKESYDAMGRLLRIDYQGGQFITLRYVAVNDTDPNFFSANQISDNFGRSLSISYDSQGLIRSILLPSGQSMMYGYDSANRLTTVSRAGYGIRTYLYSENTTVAPSGNPNLLTGIIDENGIRLESYSYDSSDRGIATEMAGGVEKYTLQYSTDKTIVTDPRGLAKTYTLTNTSGSPYIKSIARNNVGSASNVYDVAGNLTQKSLFTQKTTYIYDLSRNLETSRTEAAGTSLARTISTEWHSLLPLPTKITESGRITLLDYDTDGHLLSKTLTDTTLTPNVSRVWTYTYNAVGQRLSETTPANETTQYTYDPVNGNLLTMSNALNHTIRFNNYTADGQPQQVQYANGRQINYSYDNAGRLLTQSETLVSPVLLNPNGDTGTSFRWPQWLVDLINAWCQLFGTASPFSNNTTPSSKAYPNLSMATGVATTSYEYDLAGQLLKVTLPDGDIISYGYDAAHRLIRLQDSLGNTTTYTLNNAGDITATDTTDSAGVLARKSQQIYNDLGLLTGEIGANGQTLNYTYDNLENLTKRTDALNRAYSSTYDALNRKVSDTNPVNGISRYTYNNLDQLLTVKDARNNITTYTPNAFDETVKAQSPDTGLSTFSYSNGRLNSFTDARNITHSYTYDMLGRLTSRQDGSLTTTYSYDANANSTGLLSHADNTISSLHYDYDSAGRVVEKLVAIKTKQPFRVRYSYTKGGKLKQLALPSGRLIDYSYSATGRLQSVKVDGAALLTQLSHGVDGVTGWMWGTSNTYTLHSTDLDGRITNVLTSNALNRSYSYNTVNQLTSISDTLAPLGATQTFSYDNLDRLTQQQLGTLTLNYSYDLNSNRTSQSSVNNGVTTTTPSTIQTTSNRVTNRSSTVFQYLATGQLVRDEARTYTYDDAGRSSAIQRGSVGLANFYDPLGQRIKKVSGTLVTYFVYDEVGQLLGEYDETGQMLREYIWLEHKIVGMVSSQQANKLLRVHTDHLGTVRAVSSGSSVLWRWEEDAFGSVLPNGDVDGNGQVFTMPVRHAGQYYDAESGLFYNYYRDYDPASGRYVESDPIGLRGGLNTYGYVEGNPLRWVDVYGLEAGFPGLPVPNLNIPYTYIPPAPPPQSIPGQLVGGTMDFGGNYKDMRDANTIGGDKYFHCKANCEASRRGGVGRELSCIVSDTREWVDQNVKGDPATASAADQAANHSGRNGGSGNGLPCEMVCQQYRPNGLPLKY